MSEYCKPIEKSFVCRTNKFIQEYDGQYDATVLLNCMLGLLLVPFEKNKDRFEDEDRTSVISDLFGRLQYEGRYNCYGKGYSDYTIIRHLRNAIAHFNIKSFPDQGSIKGFKFFAYERDNYCVVIDADCPCKSVEKTEQIPVFEAQMTIEELKELAAYIKEYVLEIEENKKCRSCDYRR